MPLGDIFKKVQVATSVYREADRLYYDAVAEEMQQGIRDDGLWLMAFERAEGDETRTKAFYIGLRVRRLKEQETIMAAAAQTKHSSEPPVTPPTTPYSPDPTQKPYDVVGIIVCLFILFFAAILVAHALSLP